MKQLTHTNRKWSSTLTSLNVSFDTFFDFTKQFAGEHGTDIHKMKQTTQAIRTSWTEQTLAKIHMFADGEMLFPVCMIFCWCCCRCCCCCTSCIVVHICHCRNLWYVCVCACSRKRFIQSLNNATDVRLCDIPFIKPAKKKKHDCCNLHNVRYGEFGYIHVISV